MPNAKFPSSAKILAAVSKTIREFRLSRNMSQEALATASGIDRGYMGSLCRGEHMPTVETVLKVCAGMEVPPEVFTRELMKKFRNNRKST